jgi:ferredoxin
VASQKIVMHFPERLIDEPIISRLSKRYDLEFNIIKAQIQPQREGLMVIVLSGDAKNLRAGLEWATGLGVRIQPLEQDVVRDEALCTQCGACITVCPVEAFSVDRKTWEIGFDRDKCIGCELCVPICPPGAMKVSFGEELVPA